jgi:molybdopterin/thiamine biosynthesis adenylyltransferase
LKKQSESNLDHSRIEYLLSPEQFSDIKVTIIGLGSGGAPVCDHLVMNGIRNWDLYDMDTLDGVNLVKHPRLRKDIGRSKVEIQKEWILDRNPSAKVNAFAQDVMDSTDFLASIRTSDLVLMCPDKKSVREYISDLCVNANVPFVTASVFRTGIGGEIYGYIPNETGCYKCLQLFALTNDSNLTDDDLGLTNEEANKIYGLNDREFRASGLSVDIHMIAMIQTRMALSFLLRKSKTSMPLLKSNWIIFGNRPAKGIFSKHFETKQMLLHPQKDCFCLRKTKKEKCKNE